MNRNGLSMKYKRIDKTGDELSILGYGCMRYPRENGRINFEETKKQIRTAINNGVNYFDTAYMYPQSEEVLGKILSNGYREKVKIATKAHILRIKNIEDMKKVFQTQLKRLQTSYIDYYLLHDITLKDWENFKKMGVLSFLENEKRKGRIKNLGFSFHGNINNFKKILDGYDWDMTLIQYNYIDENYQVGEEGLEYASSKNVGIMIMEPLRGGMLINKLSKESKKLIEDFPIKKSPAEWALRWLWNDERIDVVISGMSSQEDIMENVSIASEVKPNSLNESELELINKLKKNFKDNVAVDCTGCGYCLPCPSGVDIPLSFSYYNDKKIFKRRIYYSVFYLLKTVENRSYASLCVKCGVCEKKCPQNIPIMKELDNVKSNLETWYYKLLYKTFKIVERIR
ncbi:MAG: aldo/keto reductase [Methanobrevibacter sp.]|jgi:predicted aldo/keto reductase-like oxidoreductase|nr:aldo/keto reductase [Candidatus Methanovirga aequatorialis]